MPPVMLFPTLRRFIRIISGPEDYATAVVVVKFNWQLVTLAYRLSQHCGAAGVPPFSELLSFGAIENSAKPECFFCCH